MNGRYFLTFRSGHQVELAPFLSRSMSSIRSDVPCIGNVKVVFRSAGLAPGFPGSSGRGPSHSSVLILSSEAFLDTTFLSSGEFESGDIVGFLGGGPRSPPRSSWKIGILELLCAPFVFVTHSSLSDRSIPREWSSLERRISEECRPRLVPGRRSICRTLI
jgi:hypothetical protein